MTMTRFTYAMTSSAPVGACHASWRYLDSVDCRDMNTSADMLEHQQTFTSLFLATDGHFATGTVPGSGLGKPCCFGLFGLSWSGLTFTDILWGKDQMTSVYASHLRSFAVHRSLKWQLMQA